MAEVKGTRIISNLGTDAHVTYAQAQATLDPHLLPDSRIAPKMVEISTTSPYQPSLFDQMFSSRPTTDRANIDPPVGFEGNNRQLFSFRVIPSMPEGEASADRLAAVNIEDVNKTELKAITGLVTEVSQLEKDHAYIRGRRYEFSKA